MTQPQAVAGRTGPEPGRASAASRPEEPGAHREMPATQGSTEAGTGPSGRAARTEDPALGQAARDDSDAENLD